MQLIISDWSMPNCSGLDLVKKVREGAIYAKVPFIMLAAEAEVTQVNEALVSGFTNYMVKPFQAETLHQKLEQTQKKVTG